MMCNGFGWLATGLVMAVLGLVLCLAIVGIPVGLPLGALSIIPLRRWRLARGRAGEVLPSAPSVLR